MVEVKYWEEWKAVTVVALSTSTSVLTTCLCRHLSGAFANEHSGNKRLRQLAIERKARFEAGNYSEKKMLAHEIVKLIGDLNPPGRFLKRIPSNQRVDPADPLVAVSPTEDECGWCQLEDDMAVQKACQVMRDISRPDRQERDEMRRLRRLTKDGRTIDNPEIARATVASVDFPVGVGIVIADDAAAERGEYVVNTTDQALDRTLEGV